MTIHDRFSFFGPTAPLTKRRFSPTAGPHGLDRGTWSLVQPRSATSRCTFQANFTPILTRSPGDPWGPSEDPVITGHTEKRRDAAQVS